METKFFDSELKVMSVLWEHGDMTAKMISDILKKEIGWNINTTYTVIKKCIAKGAIERIEPNFLCRALVSREMAQEAGTDELISKLFDGSYDTFFAALLDRKNLNREQIESLKQKIESMGEATV